MNTKKVSIYMRNILYILFLGLILQSCYTKYSICLSSVESPDNTKERFGKTKITSIKDVNLSKYRYEDTYIDIPRVLDVFNRFRQKYSNVRLIPQVHKFLKIE